MADVNYVIEQFPLDAVMNQNWGGLDIGYGSQNLFNGMTEYEYISDGIQDGGQVPLKFIIKPADPLTHAVRANEFTLSNQTYDAIVFQNDVVTNGFRYTNSNVLPQDVIRVEFWDRFASTPLNPNNYILVYAWLDPGLTVPTLDRTITLDIDGDAEEYFNIPEGYYVSLTSNFNEVPEGSTVTFTLTTNGIPDGTVVNWAASGDINLNDVSSDSQVQIPTSSSATNLVGSVTISEVEGGSDQINTFQIEVLEDNNLEGTELMIVELFQYDSSNINTGQLQTIVSIIDTTPPLPGCSDPNALNYDPFANLPCEDCIEDVFGVMQVGSNCCCEQFVAPPQTGCMDLLANNYNPNVAYACQGCCSYSPVTAKILFVNDFDQYQNVTYIQDMDFPYYEPEESGGDPNIPMGFPTETSFPVSLAGPPYATKKEKTTGPLNERFVRGALIYNEQPSQGQLPYSKRSRQGGQGYNIGYNLNNWWDGTPGIENVYSYPAQYNCIDYESLTGEFTGTLNYCSEWEQVPEKLGNMWNGFGGFYMVPKPGYTVSRHNFYIDCERIRFGTELSAQAASDGYNGEAARMCCGEKSISEFNGTSSTGFYNFTEGYTNSTLAQSWNPYCCTGDVESDEGITSVYNTWKEGTANLNVTASNFYDIANSAGSLPKTNPKIRVEKTVYINPWVYVTYDSYPDLEPLDRKQLSDNYWPGLPYPLDGPGEWHKHPIKDIFAAVEIWDMKPLDTWDWCENLYDPGDLGSFAPFGDIGEDNNYFGEIECCTWEDPNIHNLVHYGADDNYDADGNWIGGATVTAYTGCNKGDLPYSDKSYLCKGGDWWWTFEQGGAQLSTLTDMVSGSAQLDNVYESVWCAPEDVIVDAGLATSGTLAFGWDTANKFLVSDYVGWAGNYTGALPSPCGRMNNWDGTTDENSTYQENLFSIAEGAPSGSEYATVDLRRQTPNYFQRRFQVGVNNGTINPGDYQGNYLYIKAIRKVSFGDCGDFAPQDDWPVPADGARFYIKVKGSPMACDTCDASEDFFVEIFQSE